MEEFINEIKNTSTADLQLILLDQKDLYTPEEIEIMEQELSIRTDKDDLSSLESEELVNLVIRKQKEEIEYKNKKNEIEERKKQEREALEIKNEKRKSASELYGDTFEYKVLSFGDDGVIDTGYMETILNTYALDGWHIKSAYTNELGRNESSFTGTNSTVCQHIVILERKALIE